MLGQLVAICTATMGVTVLLVALVASVFSLYMGMRELSRRADAALLAVPVLAEHAAARDIDDAENPLNFLRLDPDLTRAILLAPDGRALLDYGRDGEGKSVARTAETANAALPAGVRHVEHWSMQRIVVESRIAAPAALAGATILFEYSTNAAITRALCQLVLFLCAGIAGLILIAAILRVAFARRMKPLHDVVRAMGALVDARYDVAVPALSRRDEIGAMAAAVQTFKTRLIDRDRLRSQADTMHASAADRHARITREVGHFQSTIRQALDEVAGCSDQMTVAADSLTSIATQSSGRANEAVAAIRQTTSSVSGVAVAAEDLSASILEVERQAEQTRAIVVEATHLAAETGALIKGLNAKTEAIDEIISLIQTIAAQTNLLSLNATIEAARAGESGRGFAVVAQEVKALADQTAGASQHVAEHIGSIQAAMARAVEAISAIDATIAKAERYSSVITVAVERQAVATAEISRGAADAARTAQTAADSMKVLASTVGETDQSAAQVHQSATDVGAQAQMLRAAIDQFLRDASAIEDTRAA